MLTRYGFTTVVDTGSLVDNTVAIHQRIQRDEMKGPSILTAGMPLYPENGAPNLPARPAAVASQPAAAARDDRPGSGIVRRNLARGANGTKLCVATPVGRGQVRRMSAEIARMAAVETHAQGGLVMAHPTDSDGVAAAVAAGVDIIVHTTIERIDGRRVAGGSHQRHARKQRVGGADTEALAL